MPPKWDPNRPKTAILVWSRLTFRDSFANPAPDGLRIDFGAQKVSSLGSTSDPLASKSDPLASKSELLAVKNGPLASKSESLVSQSAP